MIYGEVYKTNDSYWNISNIIQNQAYLILHL